MADVLDEVERRIRDQASVQPVGSMAWRAHMADVAHVSEVRRTFVDTDAKLLSRLLFESRERVEMARDMVEGRSGQRDEWARRLVDEIDAYRAERGWSPHGFGGET